MPSLSSMVDIEVVHVRSNSLNTREKMINKCFDERGSFFALFFYLLFARREHVSDSISARPYIYNATYGDKYGQIDIKIAFGCIVVLSLY